MILKPITAKLTASSQILPSDLAAIEAEGFTTVIDNRPDGEGEDQPSSAELSAEARSRGIAFHYLPITPGHVTPKVAQRFGGIVTEAPGRVLAYCRSGSRSEQLWATYAAQRERAGAEAAAEAATRRREPEPLAGGPANRHPDTGKRP